MRTSLPFGTLILLLSVTTAIAAPCGPGKHRHCRPEPRSLPVATVDFTAVPDITQQIVAGEPTTPLPKKAFPATKESTPYTGPTVGAAPLTRRAPTIGYKWSLD